MAIMWHRPGFRGAQFLDDDNATAAMKPVRDAIADAGWLLDGKDDASAVRRYAVRQCRSVDNHERVTVVVVEP